MNSTRAFHSWPAPQGLLSRSVNPDIKALHRCCLLVWEQGSSAVQYQHQQLCAQHSCCLGLPSGLQHLQGCCSPLEAKDMALIWSPGLSSHPSYKQLSPAVFAVLGVGINMSDHLIVAWPLLFMEMGQNKMRISLNLPPALV